MFFFLYGFCILFLKKDVFLLLILYLWLVIKIVCEMISFVVLLDGRVEIFFLILGCNVWSSVYLRWMN